MVTAYLQQPLFQDDVARWLDTDDWIGTPSQRITRLNARGFVVTYQSLGTVLELESWLARQIPLILFVLTEDLSYWTIHSQHAVELAGVSNNQAHLFDPGVDTAPITIPTDELLLAWSHLDYSYAALEVAGS